MRYICILYVLSIALSSVAEDSKIRALIIDGYSNHDWRRNTDFIRNILADSGRFEIDVSTAPIDDASDWRPAFAKYDVIIQTCNNLSNKAEWPEEVKRRLEKYVNEGGGLYIFHSANNSFVNWIEYNRMIGMGWRDKNYGSALVVDKNEIVTVIPKGEGEKTSHGARINALINRLGDHPIHKGLPRKWRAADIEVYRYARGVAENVTVLSYANEPKTGLNFPIEWVVGYGKGRVYNSTFGHVWKDQKDPDGMRCAGFQAVFVRALEWLSGGEVDSTVPGDFPSEDTVSLR